MTTSLKRALSLAAATCAASTIGAQTWNASSVPALTLEHSRRLPLWVISGKPITNLRIGAVVLQDASTHEVIDPLGVKLGLDSSCAASPAAAGRSTGPLVVCFPRANPGTYAGSITIVGDDVEAKSISLTVYSSSVERRIAGAVLIVLGILLSWFVTVFLRRLSARFDQAQPAAALRGDLQELRQRLLALQGKLTNWTPSVVEGAIVDVETKLATQNLERHGLPPMLANPFSATTASSDYAAYLKAAGDRITIIAAVIGGLERITRAAGPSDQAKIEAATAFDAIATDLSKGPNDATTAIEQLVRKCLAPPGTAAGPGGPAPELTLRQIVIRQTAISVAAWGVWATITVVVGVLALVLANPGFGTTTDLFKCLLWGLGIQVAGQQLQQLSPSSVTSTLTVAAPRA